MTRKRISQGLFEAFTEPCPECNGRGHKVVRDFPSGGKQKGGGSPSPAQVAKRTPKPAAETPPVDEPELEPEPESASDYGDVTPPEWQFAAE
jgi:ribonuclease E